MEPPSINFSDYPTEGYRFKFYFERDGLEETVKVVARTYRMYRIALKHGIARDKLFLRSYVRSCIDQRKFLRTHAPEEFKRTLIEIFYS